MTKELIQLWLDKGFEIYGVNAFYKKVNKYYPAYIDDRGIQHQEREVIMFQTIKMLSKHVLTLLRMNRFKMLEVCVIV